MSNGAGAYGAMAATGHIMEEALKAMGSIIVVEPKDFIRIVEKKTDALVVHTPGAYSVRINILPAIKGLSFLPKRRRSLNCLLISNLCMPKKWYCRSCRMQ